MKFIYLNLVVLLAGSFSNANDCPDFTGYYKTQSEWPVEMSIAQDQCSALTLTMDYGRTIEVRMDGIFRELENDAKYYSEIAYLLRDKKVFVYMNEIHIDQGVWKRSLGEMFQDHNRNFVTLNRIYGNDGKLEREWTQVYYKQ